MNESKKKRITALFCFHNADKSSGATRSLLDIIDNLVVMDDVEIIAAFPQKEGSAIDYLRQKSIYIIPSCFGGWCFGNYKYKIVDWYYESKIVLKSLLTYSFLMKIGKILKDRNIDVVYNNTITMPVGALIKKKYGIPLIWHVREFGYEDHRINVIGGTERLYLAMNQYADRVICISNSLANKYKRFVDPQKIVVLHNDISDEYIISDHTALELEKRCNILMAGTLQRTKGQIDAIKAVERLKKEHPQVHLYIAGHTRGAYYNELNKYVEEHQLTECVHFTGFITDMNELRRKMDIAVIASSSEAFGRVTVEAMLSGLLVIGANCGATKELIKDHCNGYLYNPCDVDDLKTVIFSAIKDNEGSQRIAATGQKEAIEKYTTGKCSSIVNDMIKELASKNGIGNG